MRFDSLWEFSLPDGSMGRNVIFFGPDMSSSLHFDNKYKDLLILGEGITQRLDDTTLTAGVKYTINYTKPEKGFALSLYYNGINS